MMIYLLQRTTELIMGLVVVVVVVAFAGVIIRCRGMSSSHAKRHHQYNHRHRCRSFPKGIPYAGRRESGVIGEPSSMSFQVLVVNPFRCCMRQTDWSCNSFACDGDGGNWDHTGHWNSAVVDYFTGHWIAEFCCHQNSIWLYYVSTGELHRVST